MKKRWIALLTCAMLVCSMLSVSAVLAEGEDYATPTDVQMIYVAAIYMDGAPAKYIGNVPLAYSETGEPFVNVKDMVDLFALNECNIDLTRYDYDYGSTKDIAGEYLGCTLAIAEGVLAIRMPEAPKDQNLHILLVLSEKAKQEDANQATSEATEVPTVEPTTEPEVEPTEEPTTEPTTDSTEAPTSEPTAEPTTVPTVEPTAEPTSEPTAEPTTVPTVEPTVEPTAEPTAEPTTEPTVEPTAEPTVAPMTVRVEIVNPQNVYYYGQDFTLRAVVENAIGAVNYQWEVLLPGAEKWQPIENAVEETYTFMIDELNVFNQYRVTVNDTQKQGE